MDQITEDWNVVFLHWKMDVKMATRKWKVGSEQSNEKRNRIAVHSLWPSCLLTYLAFLSISIHWLKWNTWHLFSPHLNPTLLLGFYEMSICSTVQRGNRPFWQEDKFVCLIFGMWGINPGSHACRTNTLSQATSPALRDKLCGPHRHGFKPNSLNKRS